MGVMKSAIDRAMMSTRRSKPGVYAIRNTKTGDCYVGSTTSLGRRYYNHRATLYAKSSRHAGLRQAFESFCPDAFEFVLLEAVTDLSLLLEREQAWIDRLKPAYNTFADARSRSGTPLTQATRDKIAASRMGMKMTPEAIAKREQTCRERGIKASRGTAHMRTPAALAKASLKLRGERNPNAKLTEADIHEIRRRLANGEVQQRIADDYGIPQTSISSIKRRKAWRHVA